MSLLPLQAQALSYRSIGRNFVHTSRGLSNPEHIKAFGKHLLGFRRARVPARGRSDPG
jgi:hypothetical protein